MTRRNSTAVWCDALEAQVTPTTEDQISAYVGFSRIKMLATIWILQPFSPWLFARGPPRGPHLLMEKLRGHLTTEEALSTTEEALSTTEEELSTTEELLSETAEVGAGEQELGKEIDMDMLIQGIMEGVSETSEDGSRNDEERKIAAM